MENQTLENIFNSAVNNYQKGNLKLAKKICHQILERDTENWQLLNLLGVIAGLEGQAKAAFAYFDQAVKLNQNNAEIHSNLGLALKENQQLETAIKHYQKAIELQPNYAEPYNGLGNIFLELGKLTESQLEAAIEYYQKALELKPNYAEPYNGLGNIFLELGKLVESQKYYQQAVKLDKNHANAHFGLASILLKQGNFIQGFNEYEWRWQKKGFSSRNFSQTLWDGSNFQGKTLLVYTEQGLGDSIQFIRYIPLVKKLGGRVIVELNQAGLKLLFTTVSGIDELFVIGEKLPDFDLQIPLMSLPRIFGTTLETIPAKIPYLSVPESTDFQMPPAPEKNLKIGICWQTSSNANTSQKRSCPVEYLQEILSIDQTNFYLLQKEVLPADLEWLNSQTQVYNNGSSFKNLADTAAAIKQLDLVISIDTAVAHLAGALGKPVWILLPFDSDWRWMLDRNNSPWYPTARLFRQTKIGDWDNVFEQVGESLKKYLVHDYSAEQMPKIRETKFTAFTAPQIKQALAEYNSGNFQETANICQNIIQKQPHNFRALGLLGLCAYQAGEIERAIAYYQESLKVNLNYAQTHNNLAVALQDKQEIDAAIKHYQKAIELQPNYAKAYNGLGFIFLELGKLVESQKYYQQAVKLDKNHANANLALAVILLKQGNFIQGFNEYEWRWQKKGLSAPNFSQPVWDGSNFQGKTLLVYTEQGLGDSIQFIRYIPLVKKLGGRVIV
ncbi:MAG: tetratricopeptide repeat protein, partial [Okeania sp. SIO1H6]|nr:tetratricopeptide repeat protein [Okeania sp. SIO1H6]